jgi:hypothetical protein
MAAFVTLCEAFTGIQPHFNLSSYYYQARLRQGLDTRVAALGSVDISVRSRPGIDPYFFGWWKAWFPLWNEANTLLPAFMGGRPIPHPNW